MANTNGNGSTSTNGTSTSTPDTTLVGRLTKAQRKLLATAAGVTVTDLHDGHIAEVQAKEQAAKEQAAKDAANTQQVAAAMKGSTVQAVVAAMPEGLSICEQAAWINSHAKGVSNSTQVPCIGADSKGLALSHSLPYHPMGWTGTEIATECDARGALDTGSSGLKLVGVKGSPVKKTTKLPGSAAGAAIRMLTQAGLVYNG